MQISLEELVGLLKDRDELIRDAYQSMSDKQRLAREEASRDQKESRRRIRDLEDRCSVLQEERNNASAEVGRMLREQQLNLRKPRK